MAGVYVKRIFTPGTPVEQVMKAVASMMTALPAKPFAVTVEVWKKPRTNQQNAYLWGVVYPAVIEGGGEALAGWTRDDLHDTNTHKHLTQTHRHRHRHRDRDKD